MSFMIGRHVICNKDSGGSLEGIPTLDKTHTHTHTSEYNLHRHTPLSLLESVLNNASKEATPPFNHRFLGPVGLLGVSVLELVPPSVGGFRKPKVKPKPSLGPHISRHTLLDVVEKEGCGTLEW